MKLFTTKKVLSIGLLLVMIILAAWPPAVESDEFFSQITATDLELSTMRGGLLINDGLLVSFGIDRAIYVNGVLDIANSFTISRFDGSNLLQQSPSSLSDVNAANVVQIGPSGSNNFLPSKISGDILQGGFTVIQNSLNNQFVKNTTSINASVINVDLYRSMNLTTLLSQQMIHSAR